MLLPSVRMLRLCLGMSVELTRGMPSGAAAGCPAAWQPAHARNAAPVNAAKPGRSLAALNLKRRLLLTRVPPALHLLASQQVCSAMQLLCAKLISPRCQTCQKQHLHCLHWAS